MLKTLALVFSFFVFFTGSALAQTQTPQKQEFFKARVIAVVGQGTKIQEGNKIYYQKLKVKIEQGPKQGKEIIIDNESQSMLSQSIHLSKGSEIIVSQNFNQSGKITYAFYDFYRINFLIIFLALFFILIVLVGGFKGLGSISGMIISLAIILIYIVPSVLKGAAPLTTAIIGSTLIIIVTTFLAHGFHKRSVIALVSTLISIVLAGFFATLAIHFGSITGLGNEDFANLQIGPTSNINIQGLFLGALIIGTLGALNDITTTQAATIEEFAKMNPKVKAEELFDKGLKVGREHIASLINTLVLAYAGSAFAIFIFFVLNPLKVPYWVILNNEIISDEVVRIIAGSIGLLLSVPIVTFLASLFYGKVEA